MEKNNSLILIRFLALVLMLGGFSSMSHAAYVSPDVSGCLNFRAWPNGAIQRCITSGEQLKVRGRRGNWLQVKDNNGVSGWLYRPMTRSTAYRAQQNSQRINRRTSRQTYVTPQVSGCLNLRSGPRAYTRSKSCVRSGTPMKVVGKRRGNWLPVKVGGKRGWVYRKMVQDTQKQEHQPSTVERTEVRPPVETAPEVEKPAIAKGGEGDAAVWKLNVSDNSRVRCSKRDTNPLKCLACNAYFEANGEPKKGRTATHYVVFNRVASRHYPNDICKVVYQRMQFSWANNGARTISGRHFKRMQNESVDAMNDFLAGKLKPNLASCSTHYVNPRHASRASWSWRRMMRRLGNVFRHTFYRMRGHKCFDGTEKGHARLVRLTKQKGGQRGHTNVRLASAQGGQR